MAVYKLFSEQDAFIRSQYPAQNTGRDEILEISNINGINQLSSAEGDLPAVNRALIQFDNSDLNNIITNTVATSSYQVSLRLYLANAGNLPLDYTIQAYPISQSWDMGTGRIADDPKTDNGCSWTFAGESGSNRWTTTGFSNYVTASFGSTVGGSTWYTGSTETFEGDLLDPESGQVFDYTSNKDINMFVTDTVRLWLTGSGGIVNNGFVVKLDDTVEFGTNFVSTNFFSMDTHTIYPPALEIKWDDSMVDNYFITGSGTGSIVTSSAFISKFTNLQSTFEDSNYFKVYMDGLEPERYYQLMVQTIVGDETIVVDSGTDYFKIVR